MLTTTTLSALALFRFGFGRAGFGHGGGFIEFLVFGGIIAVVAWALARSGRRDIAN